MGDSHNILVSFEIFELWDLGKLLRNNYGGNAGKASIAVNAVRASTIILDPDFMWSLGSWHSVLKHANTG